MEVCEASRASAGTLRHAAAVCGELLANVLYVPIRPRRPCGYTAMGKTPLRERRARRFEPAYRGSFTEVVRGTKT